MELLALKYQRQDGFLAISGLVRNPEGGTVTSQLSVLAMAFDQAGVMVASDAHRSRSTHCHPAASRLSRSHYPVNARAGTA